jgi:hypothetical protein
MNEKPPREWLVWSYEHRGWWKPTLRGYTAELAEAGRYTLAQATEICEKANRYADTVQEKMVHISEANEFKP